MASSDLVASGSRRARRGGAPHTARAQRSTGRGRPTGSSGPATDGGTPSDATRDTPERTPERSSRGTRKRPQRIEGTPGQRSARPPRQRAERPGRATRPAVAATSRTSRLAVSPGTGAALAAVAGIATLAVAAFFLLGSGQVHVVALVLGAVAIGLAVTVRRERAAASWQRLLSLVGLVLGVAGSAVLIVGVVSALAPSIGVHLPDLGSSGITAGTTGPTGTTRTTVEW